MAVMHGANAPLLQRMIEKEIRKERQVLKGEAVRDPIMLEDAVPGKFQKRKDKFKIRPTFHFLSVKSKSKAASNLWADTDEEDNADSQGNDDKEDEDDNNQQQNFSILALEQYLYEDDQVYLLLKSILDQEHIEVFQTRDVVLTLDDIRFLTSGTKCTEDQMDEIVTKLLEAQCRILMLRTEEGVKVRPKIKERFCLPNWLNGFTPDSPAVSLHSSIALKTLQFLLHT